MQTRTNVATPIATTHSIPHEKIAMRAYEKWCKRGRPGGTEKQDWFEAEMELRSELSRVPQAQAINAPQAARRR